MEEARDRADLLARELNHRVKNTLANVLSIVTLTRRRAKTLDEFADGLDGRAAGVFPEARQHVPAAVAAAAADRARELGADGCVAVGGGSSVGLGKAVALRQEVLHHARRTLVQRLAAQLHDVHQSGGQKKVALRQSDLADLLHVRRAGVSTAAAALRAAGAVRLHRGGIEVADVATLASASGLTPP